MWDAMARSPEKPDHMVSFLQASFMPRKIPRKTGEIAAGPCTAVTQHAPEWCGTKGQPHMAHAE
jgi:hypothetical protein